MISIRNSFFPELDLKFRWLNCFWLLVPVLVWNLVFATRLPQEVFHSDVYVPQWLLIAENILRIVVFALPLLLPLQGSQRSSRFGIALYLVGTTIYFASWLPLMLAPAAAWSTSTLGLLAPYVTPLLVFLGITLIANSWIYGLAALAFIAVHTLHALFALQVL
jgi:hypothetical protein